MTQLGNDAYSFESDLLWITTIVSTLVEAVLFVISLFVPVGTFLVAIYTIIDTLLTVVSLFTDEVDSLQNMIVEAIVDAVYNIDLMIDNFDSEDRLTFGVDYRLLQPTMGYIEDNSLIYTLNLTNTIMAPESF